MVAALAPPTTMAQVGFSPESSPYRPIRARHLFGFSGGYVWGDAGDAGVGPTNGPFGGVTFDMLFGGPVALSFNGWYADLERVVTAPGLPPDERTSGPYPQSVTVLDANLQFVITGSKSWHRLSPYVGLGIGIAFGGTVPQDSTGFSFGTRFVVQPAAGFRFYLTDRIVLTSEAKDVLWRLSYPQTYLTVDDPILDPRTQKANEWTHNFVLRFVLSYAFGIE